MAVSVRLSSLAAVALGLDSRKHGVSISYLPSHKQEEIKLQINI
jgi:hypothetical protein